MKRILLFIGAAVTLLSCERVDIGSGDSPAGRDGEEVPHGEIVLGGRLEDPYKTENMTKALLELYPTKADRVTVSTTDLYVRFLPESQEEFDLLKASGVELMDHPLDYEIVREGDWYHDPSIDGEDITWQYAVVPKDFEFPQINHQILHECYIAANDPQTKSDGLDWDAVERKSYELTGNGAMLDGTAVTRGGRVNPEGRITIVDNEADGGKPVGVSGVMVSCNAFVKFARAYTDRDGYYRMDRQFSSKLRYRLVFKNERNFSIGLNLILVPASVSTLGKSDPSGVSLNVTADSEEKLFRRCVVNNAVYDYISRCDVADMNISAPPADLRLWIMGGLECSSTPMIHQGAVVSHSLLKGFLGAYAVLVKLFLPDVTVGLSGKTSYRGIWTAVVHELAHTSHYAKVGNDYWNKYVEYILRSFASSGSTYGTGNEDGSGYCAVGEMWAYYLESMMQKDRYGGYVPDSGDDFWFKPQILKYIDERGVGRDVIFASMSKDVTSTTAFRDALIESCPEKSTMIEQAFARYSEQ